MVCLTLGLFVISLFYVSFTESSELYLTTVMKNTYDIFPNHAENFVIPDGQCSGFIDRSLFCCNREPGAVHVQIKDNVAFPSVNIDNSLHNATIQRASGTNGFCTGEADVQLSYNRLQDQAPIRQRRSVRHLPPAPAH